MARFSACLLKTVAVTGRLHASLITEDLARYVYPYVNDFTVRRYSLAYPATDRPIVVNLFSGCELGT